MQIFYNSVETLSDFLWGGNWGDLRLLPVGLLTLLLLGTGLYMMVRIEARPLRRLGPALKQVWSARHPTPNSPGDITAWQALSTALSGQVGTGNLAGVATAITLGGPGAIFWMWITAILGMALAFAESSLSVKFRQKAPNGRILGGPMYYIRHGLGEKWHWLAVVFCIGTVFSATATGGMVQSHSLTRSVQNATSGLAEALPCQLTRPAHSNWRIQLDDGAIRSVSGCELSHGNFEGRLIIVDPQAPATEPARPVLGNETSLALHPAIVGVIISALVFVVIIGGIKSIGRVAGYLVPFMALFYVTTALLVLIFHASEIPAALAQIFTHAFGFEQAAGGFAGGLLAMAIRAGVARGLFSNEAGQGSAPIAHAAAKTQNPVQQGEIAMIGVFIDTIIICTMTALVILCVPGDFVGPNGEAVRHAWQAGNLEASAITTSAYSAAFPGGEWVVVLALALFAFTTIIGWSYYAEQAISYLTGGQGILLFRYAWVLIIFCGTFQEVSFVWKLGDLANATMVLPNLVAILALSATVIAMHKADQNQPDKRSPSEP